MTAYSDAERAEAAELVAEYCNRVLARFGSRDPITVERVLAEPLHLTRVAADDHELAGRRIDWARDVLLGAPRRDRRLPGRKAPE